ncbi:hypothetical protein [Streptomyces avicenniae]|uniref:hypothetical protein n=1 Tax=Streptomyces avicenniae TaxID=500153 RepID=UPI00069CB477|nr:hypothetical protein [Streptomyces avicenniae]
MRITSALTTVGNALILQLTFLVCALPLVTYGPAAVALQRQLAEQRDGRVTGVGSYLREFRAACREAWPLGVLVAAASLGFLAGIPFWYAVDGPPGAVGLVLLVALLGLAVACWLGLLQAAEQRRGTHWRTWLAPAAGHLATRPLHSAWAVVQFLTWLALMAFAPALVLVGAGLIPALIVHWTLGQDRARARELSAD